MSSPTLLLATHNGVYSAVSKDETWLAEPAGLSGRHVTTIIAREGVILVGTQDGIFRSSDQGQTWQSANTGLTQRHVRWLAYHPTISDLEFAGTEPAALFVSEDGGTTWQERSEVAALRDKHDWFLPYSPEAGCVRGFAFHGQRAYAAVEVGGLLRSDDGGASWALAPGSRGVPEFNHSEDSGDVHPDVHSVAVHPANPDFVYAPTGGGFFRSQDGGATWRKLHPAGYTRAVWVDPVESDCMLLGTAQSVSRNGDVAVSNDGGANWKPANAGLDTPWPRDMVERFYPLGPDLLAVTARGHLFVAQIGVWQWQKILPELPPVNAVWEGEIINN